MKSSRIIGRVDVELVSEVSEAVSVSIIFYLPDDAGGEIHRNVGY
jgi:hypothetical protein